VCPYCGRPYQGEKEDNDDVAPVPVLDPALDRDL